MIPGMFGAAACVFYLRQFFMGIPSETLEAARLDGVGYFGMFFKMMLPLSVPALIAQGVLGFVGGYNDYLGPMLYVSSTEFATLQVVLSQFTSQKSEQNIQMACTVIALLPTVVIYLVAQRYFIEGIAVSGLK
jgi:multiple sugar transport system permease protein